MSALWPKIPWLGFGVWWPVLISGIDGICRHTFRRVPSLQFPSDLPLRLRIHHNGKSIRIVDAMHPWIGLKRTLHEPMLLPVVQKLKSHRR